jgi:hypothetical protein
MANESGDGRIMEEIGGLLVHAEQAQAALDKGLAVQAQHAEAIARLILHADLVLKQLRAEAEQIGARAERAGAEAVREQVRESLSKAGADVGKAAGIAFAPLAKGFTQQIEDARRAAIVLDKQAAKFSDRACAVILAGAVGALALIVLGLWAALSWQRAELANLALEKADRQGEIDGMKATAQKMQAQGLKIEFGNCGEHKGRVRVCVAIEPGLKPWGTEQAPFAILKGY